MKYDFLLQLLNDASLLEANKSIIFYT